MSRLYLKIFLWFWATALATATALVIAFVLWSGQNHSSAGNRSPKAPFSPPSIWFVARQWTVAICVSGLICLLLTRYLVAPILSVRAISRELAGGNLKVRVSGRLERRRDEIGDLVRDFNTMASRIEQLVSQQRQLMFDISHELRSPLARLNVALDLEREKDKSNPVLDQIEQDLNSMNEMIGRILTVAKLDAYAEPLSIEDVNVPDMVAEVVHNATFEAQRRGVTLRSSIPSSTSRVAGNAALLYSAVENAVRNAIAYTDPDTEVAVSVFISRDRQMCVCVSDSGPGVPESELESIFRPFYRVDESRDRSIGGTGLGLAIADRIVRLHKGAIRAKNNSPKGLLIEIALPLADIESSTEHCT